MKVAIIGSRNFNDYELVVETLLEYENIITLIVSGGTVAETPWLDGKHVVFGEVTSGMEIVKRIEALGDSAGKPSKPVTITACGVLDK